MWQKCPVCSGTGKHTESLEKFLSVPCNVCNGKGIISEITGLPPKEAKNFDTEIVSGSGVRLTGEWDNIVVSRQMQQDKKYNIVEAYYNK